MIAYLRPWRNPHGWDLVDTNGRLLYQSPSMTDLRSWALTHGYKTIDLYGDNDAA